MIKRFLYKIGWHVLRVYWFIARPHQRGAKCIIEHAGQLLLIRNTYGRGHWTFSGGIIEPGETPEQAVIREVREELQIRLERAKPIGSFINRKDFKVDEVFVFHCEVDSLRFEVDPVEIATAQWFAISNLPADISPVAQRMVQMWLKKKPTKQIM